MQRLLVKIRSSTSLAAADSRRNLRPLYDELPSSSGLGLAPDVSWYLADLPEGGPNPWDSAHSQVAAALGLGESDVLYAEPDLAQSYPDANERKDGGRPLVAAGASDEGPDPRVPDGTHFAWHLDDEFSQLRSARNSVSFRDPRVRIAHIDTGYDPNHAARPARILHDLERNFVDEDGNPNSAADPNRGRLFDQSGHGTGTIGILAGQRVAQNGDDFLGGAPYADILPIRIANSVVLVWTSTFAQGLSYAIAQKCDVVSISMGGLPSHAWNEAVNLAYERGICIVAASGDCINGLPTHHVVYPARYHRTITVCGVMADGRPYYNLPLGMLEGNWGPDSSMSEALASYTPNIPWAELGTGNKMRLNGAGTSASTPQIAAAVALWLEKNKDALVRDWTRVEAVRYALFGSALVYEPKYFGHGILKANAALTVPPPKGLIKVPPDNDSFAFLRVLTGLGLTDTPSRQIMFDLEMTQRWLLNSSLQEAVPDPEAPISRNSLRQFIDALIHDDKASIALRQFLAERYTTLFGGAVAAVPGRAPVAPRKQPVRRPVEIPKPEFRRVRSYAVDPSFSTRLESAAINQAVVKIKWEDLKPGPVGGYVEVIDYDPANGALYDPVNLDDPSLSAQDGYAPSEGNPGFHQQMVYAVVTDTIAHFESALGRKVLWRPKPDPSNEFDDSHYVERLRIYPHGLREANAYYSPQKVALLFGYFRAADNDPGDHVPGSTVFTCLSQDIVAHETTHAILDGMYRRFTEPTNRDVLAFHEAFADIVALFRHFTMTEVLENQISRTRGDLEAESLLGSLAVQFGRATGARGALRNAIGTLESDGKTWHRIEPKPSDYEKTIGPHERGALLVAAVFDAFLAIYKSRTADLLRIYSGGTGVLPAGSIHPDLVRRLAAEAAKSARHVLSICIRALDYIPPVDITFGEFLRGMITADVDLVPDDRHGYRVAFVEAFRRRGIYPLDLRTLSVDTLRWQGFGLGNSAAKFNRILTNLRSFANQCLYADRERLFELSRKHRLVLHNSLQKIFTQEPALAEAVGLDATITATNRTISFEVHSLRRCERIGPDGQHLPQVVVSLTQSRPLKINGSSESPQFRGGATFVIDLPESKIRYAIAKRINSQTRQRRTVEFLTEFVNRPLRETYFGSRTGEPFALLHRDAASF